MSTGEAVPQCDGLIRSAGTDSIVRAPLRLTTIAESDERTAADLVPRWTLHPGTLEG